MYINDMRHTRGHASGVTDGHWHPEDPHIFITSSTDTRVRL